MNKSILFSLMFLVFNSSWSKELIKWTDFNYSGSTFEFYTLSDNTYTSQPLPRPIPADIERIYCKKDGNFYGDLGVLIQLAPSAQQILMLNSTSSQDGDFISNIDIVQHEYMGQKYWIPTGNLDSADPRFISYVQEHALDGITGISTGLKNYEHRVEIYKKLIFTAIIPEGVGYDELNAKLESQFGYQIAGALDYSQSFGTPWDGGAKTLGDIITTYCDDAIRELKQIEKIGDLDKIPNLKKFVEHFQVNSQIIKGLGAGLSLAGITKQGYESAMRRFTIMIYANAEAELRLNAFKKFVQDNGTFDPAFSAALAQAETEFIDYATGITWRDILWDVLYDSGFYGFLTDTALNIAREAIYNVCIASGKAVLGTALGAVFIVAEIGYKSWIILNEGDELLQSVVGAATIERNLRAGLLARPITSIENAQYHAALQSIRQFFAFLFYANFVDRQNSWSEWINVVKGWLGDDGFAQYKSYLSDQKLTQLYGFEYYRPYHYPLAQTSWNRIVELCAVYPHFTNYSVTPESGFSDTHFQFFAIYRDFENLPPDQNSIRVSVTGAGSIDMIPTNGGSDWIRGQQFESAANLNFNPGLYSFNIQGTQNHSPISYAEDLSSSKTFTVLRNSYLSSTTPVSPKEGFTANNFNFCVTYKSPSNLSPDGNIQLIIDGIAYDMAAQGSTWAEGVDYIIVLQGSNFTEVGHFYHFEGIQGLTNLRYPDTGELSFAVKPIIAEGITLDLIPNPATLNSTVTVTATINPPIPNYSMNFFDEPDKGNFGIQNPVQTDANGCAVNYYTPYATGLIDIFAVDANNQSKYTSKRLTVQNPQYKFIFSHQRIGIEGNEVNYDITVRVYDASDNPVYNSTYTMTTTLGHWENGQQSITAFSQGSYIIGQRLSSPSDGTASVSINIDSNIGGYTFEVQKEIPIFTFFRMVSVPQSVFLSFSPVDDKIAVTTGTFVKVYDISEDQFVNQFVFNDPVNENPVAASIVRFSPDGTKLFVGSEWGSRILNSSTGASLAKNSNILFTNDSQWGGDACWVNNDYIIAGSSNKKNVVLSATNLAVTRTLKDESYEILAVDAAGGKALLGSSSEEAFLFNTTTWSQIRSYNPPGNGSNITSVALSPDGNQSAIGDTYDHIIYIYNNNSGLSLSSFSDNSDSWKLDWNPAHTDYLLGLQSNSKAPLWDVNSGIVNLAASNLTPSGEVCWSGNGEMFAAVGGGQLKIFAPFDQAAPNVTITSPPDNHQTGLSTIELAGYVNDDRTISSVEYRLNNGSWLPLTLNSDNAFALLISLSVGANIIEVRAIDSVGKNTTKCINVTTISDHDGPIFIDAKISSDTPIIGSFVTVSIWIIDGGSGIDASTVRCEIQNPDGTTVRNIVLHDDGLNGDAAAADSTYSCQLGTAGLAEKRQFIDFYASDKSSNPTTLDNGQYFTPYDLAAFSNFAHVPENPVQSQLITIHATIQDQSGINNTILYYANSPIPDPNINAVGLLMNQTEGNVYAAQIPGQTELDFYYFIDALDGAGNVSRSETQHFQIGQAATLLTIPFNSGWNWFSINVCSDDMSTKAVLSSLSANGQFIKSQTSFSTFYPGIGWYSSNGLDEIDVGQMYMIKMSTFDLLEHEGQPVDYANTPITLTSGWNWIGYLPQQPNSLNSALATISSNGDLIKNQTSFARLYQDLGWYSSNGLEEMHGGEGYLLKMNGPNELVYGVPSLSLARKFAEENDSTLIRLWPVNIQKYEHTMAVTGVVMDAGKELVTDGYYVGAFVGPECRGCSRLCRFPINGRFEFEILVHGETDEVVKFKVYKIAEESFRVSETEISFEPDGIVGNGLDPCVINLTMTTSNILGEIPRDYQLYQNYPNPFNPTSRIKYDLPDNSTVVISIFDTRGRLVRQLCSERQISGQHEIVWDGRNSNNAPVVSGIYFYQIRTEKFSETKKMILIK